MGCGGEGGGRSEERCVATVRAGNADANAVLIAAAPDLLAFAQAMELYFEFNPTGFNDLKRLCSEVLAKAEGLNKEP